MQQHVSGHALSVRIASLLAAPGSELLDATVAVPAGAVGPALASLSDGEMTAVGERAAHLREMLTGYRSGSLEHALPGEPRAAYAPGVPLMERYRAKAAELGVGVTSLRRWTSAFEAGEDLLAALPGYKGPDVYGRGEHPELEAYYFVDELELIIREWIAERYHRRAHDGLVAAEVPRSGSLTQ